MGDAIPAWLIMKLLIAEDNRAMRSLIKQICQGVTQDILECSNGLEAIALYEAARPDWVQSHLHLRRFLNRPAWSAVSIASPLTRCAQQFMERKSQ